MIIALCGSVKNRKLFEIAGFLLEMQGHCVLSLPCFTSEEHQMIIPKDGFKKLAEAHYQRIDLADAIMVCNPKFWDSKTQTHIVTYRGSSTFDEMMYAKKKGKYILFVSDLFDKIKSMDGPMTNMINGLAKDITFTNHAGDYEEWLKQ